jgi:hypothetical protein
MNEAHHLIPVTSVFGNPIIKISPSRYGTTAGAHKGINLSMGINNCTPPRARRLTGKNNTKTIKIIISQSSLRRDINILCRFLQKTFQCFDNIT